MSRANLKWYLTHSDSFRATGFATRLAVVTHAEKHGSVLFIQPTPLQFLFAWLILQCFPSACICEHAGNSSRGNGLARNIMCLRTIAESNSFHMRNSELRQRHHCVGKVLILVTKVHDSLGLLNMGIPILLCQEQGKILTSLQRIPLREGLLEKKGTGCLMYTDINMLIHIYTHIYISCSQIWDSSHSATFFDWRLEKVIPYTPVQGNLL